VFLKAAQNMGTSPESCIVIEDAVAGVEGAKNAGMKCIAVTNTNTAEALSKADLIYESLEALDQRSLLKLFEQSNH
jgi:beta-phosphoglucomutase-like phosphatase (HAD superfamily)